MNRQQMVRAGRCRKCGAKGPTPHTDECIWIGGVCEYQLQPTEPQDAAEAAKLKPCPFCGAKAHQHYDFVSCSSCGISTAVSTAEHSAAEWNARAIESAPTQSSADELLAELNFYAPDSVCLVHEDERPDALKEDIQALLAFRAEERKRLRLVVTNTNDALLELNHGDHEEIIACHADTLPELYREMALAVEKAVDILQVEIHAMIDPDPLSPTPGGTET